MFSKRIPSKKLAEAIKVVTPGNLAAQVDRYNASVAAG